ncbi:hypothetical protein GRZ55_13360 [Chelativorans sp. ZYF759]|uniref:hypothetical protein n=1 Tax=Chelativorans sp. ZYF759 TaxID=2692213 RepID=UPI00145F50FF|nr:hypothetical protein [Chelativorans sp. ZYF759]NMG40231.1 hypothetical protein [Chelativorans sp. ZYF759]
MTETHILTDRDEIRDWAASRMGAPAFIDQSSTPGGADAPVLTMLFDQAAYQDQDTGPDRPTALGGPELVDWDDWMAQLESQNLALKVLEDEPGRLDSYFEVVSRDE